MAGTFTVDDRAQKALMRHYDPKKLERVFTASARAGANAVSAVLERAAPVGTSKRLGQFYRREGLGHGTLKASVKARKIRKTGIQRRTIGYVVGPGGKNVSSRRGFIRVWVAGGTRPHEIRMPRGGVIQHPGQRANPWVARASRAALAAGEQASDAAILRHVSKIPRS